MRLVVNSRTIGDLDNGTLIKQGRQAVLFHALDGFGVADEVLDNPFVERIQIHYEGKVYEATVDRFKEKGIPNHRPPYEPQTVLQRRWFTVTNPYQTKLFKE